jgi:hypothetical protein
MLRPTSVEGEDMDDRLEMGLYPNMVFDLPVDSSVEVPLDDIAIVEGRRR